MAIWLNLDKVIIHVNKKCFHTSTYSPKVRVLNNVSSSFRTHPPVGYPKVRVPMTVTRVATSFPRRETL